MRTGFAISLLVLAAGFAAGSTRCLAATEGTVGPSSSGSLTITLNVEPAVRLSGSSDVRLTPSDAEHYRGRTALCVWARGNGGYQLRATGSGEGGRFTLADGSIEARYELRFDDGSGYRNLSTGEPLTGLVSGGAVAPDCSDSEQSSQLEVVLPRAQQKKLDAGIYAGTVTLTIVPE